MKTTFHVVAALALAGVTAAQGARQAEIGAIADYQFSGPLLNGKGLRSLAELRGKPVIIDFWGTRCGPCIGSAVPSAVKMQQEHGDDIQVILVEVQGSDQPAVEQFALGKKWLGTGAVWTTERPVLTNATTIPNCVVLDAEGRVAMMGNPISMHGDIEELIEASKRARAEKPEDLPRELDKAWKSLAKGEFGEAWQDCQGVAGRSQDAGIVSYATELGEKAKAGAVRAVARIDRMVAEGWAVEAQEYAEDLEKTVKGLEEQSDEVAKWLERLDGDEFEAEVDAAKELAKLERRLFDKGVDPGLVKRLEKLAEKHAGTKAAERAARYAQAE